MHGCPNADHSFLMKRNDGKTSKAENMLELIFKMKLDHNYTLNSCTSKQSTCIKSLLGEVASCKTGCFKPNRKGLAGARKPPMTR